MSNITHAFKLSRLSFFILLVFGRLPGDAQPVKKTVSDSVGCGCPVITYAKPAYRYFPALADRISYPSLAGAMGWGLVGEKKSFDLLFMMNDWPSGGEGNFHEQLSLVSPRDPIRITHPDNTFTLNLTPCRTEDRFYVLPVSVDCKQRITEEVRGFDHTKFQNTTAGYVHLFMQMSHRRPDQIIRKAIKYLGHNYGAVRVNEVINKMNKEFATGIPLVTEENCRDSLTISAMLDSLVAKKVRQEMVLTDAFILSQPGIHPPTSEEQDKIEIFFEGEYPYYARELFDPKKLRPEIYANFNGGRAVVELSSKIIAQKSEDPKNTPVNSEVWVDLKAAYYMTDKGLITIIERTCLPPSVIAGTSIGIDFSQTILISDPVQIPYQFDRTQFPGMALPVIGNKDSGAGPSVVQYDTLLTRFTGLMVKEATLQLPGYAAVFMLKGQNLIINNRLIAGCIAVDLAPKTAGKVIIKQNNGPAKTIATSVFLAMLNKAGLNNLVVKPAGGQLNVYFKKIGL